MRKPDITPKTILLTAAVVLLAGSTWAIKSWQQPIVTAINGTAFYDCNANSIRDNNEPTFGGMTVLLNGRTTAGDSVNVATTTDGTGKYSFIGLAAGNFVVKFNFPNGTTALSFTAKSTAPDGSDANADGSTDPLSIDGSTNVQGIDVGVIDRTAPIVSFTHPFLLPYNNGDTITVECDNLPTMNATWATARDNSGAAVTVQFLDFAVSVNNCAVNGYITILNCIFRSTDACGNVGEKNVFIKVKDSTPPVLSGIPTDTTVNTARGERIPTAASGILSNDNCAQNGLTVAFSETESPNTCGKIITRTWSTSDDCGNSTRRSQRITVISDATCGNVSFPSDTFRLVLSVNQRFDTCFNLTAGSVLSNIQYCGIGQPNTTITLTASNCVRVTPSVNAVGMDTFCARICDVNGQNCRDLKLFITIQALRFTACDILGGRTNINLMPRVCGDNACYCIVGTTTIRTLNDNYTVTDNGRPYDGGFSGCQFDTVFSYNYFTVPEMGANGPYRLDSWQVNGTTRQIATFQTMQELVDSMNIWDPMGNWRIDPTRFLIYGGDMRSQYGQMRIARLSNLAFGVLELNTGLISNGVKLCFSTGLHTIIFKNNITGCADTLRANVFCENDFRAPIAVNDRVSTPKNTPLRIAATLNDTLNGVFESLVATNQPRHGSVGFQNAQTFLYTPNTDYCGRDTFDYRLCNAFGLCDTAQIFIDVTCNNDTTGNTSRRPVAVDDAVTTRLNTAATFSVLANDTLNGTLSRPLSIVRFQNHGAINIVGNQIVYTPQAGFCNGRDSFDYEICNANGCDTARVIVLVTCENDGSGRPTAVDDRITTRFDSLVSIPVLTNDILNGFLTRPIGIVINPRHGMAFISNNQIVYMPNATFCGGNDTLDYVICNAIGCDTARVIIGITCGNDTTAGVNRRRPIAIDDRTSTRLNTSITIAPLANDTLNGVLVRPLSIVGFARYGTAFSIGNQIMYIPETGLCGGNDTLDYEICNTNGCDTGQIIVAVSCDNGLPKPIAVDDVASTRLNTPVTVDVLANDTRNGALTRPVTVVRTPRRGLATVQNNQIIYTSDTAFCGGNDTLAYEICNINGCDTAEVVVSVLCDSTTGGGSGRVIVAVNDNVTTRKNTGISFKPTLNDTIRTQLLALMIIQSSRNGTIGFMGLDTLVYTPNLDFCGRDTFTYAICDTSFICSEAFVFVNVTCDTVVIDSRKPIAQNDFVTTQKGRAVTIAALANDSIFTALTNPVRVIRSPSRGLFTIQNNQIVYTPNADFCGGQDSMTYEICNTNGCDTGKIYVAVTCDTTINNGSNRPIVAVDDAISTRKNVQIAFKPTLNDTIRTRLLALMIINSPRNGTISFTGLDTLIYAPNVGFCGRDTLEYSICDTSFNCDNAFIYVNVSCDSTGGNLLLPIAINDTARTGVNQAVVVNVLQNDTLNGVFRGPLSITGRPRFGTALVDRNNQIIYTPQAGFCGGRDTLTYALCNANGCDTAIVSINVICDTNTSNRLPVAVPDYVTTRKRTPIRVPVLANDTLNGTLDSIRIVRLPRRGVATLGNDNVLTYSTDTCGFSDTLIYRICNRNGCDTALVTINVPCQNDTTGGGRLLPIAVNDTARTAINVPVTVTVLQNDTLNGVLTGRVGIVGKPRFGFALVNADSQIVYTPQNGFCGGRDTVRYEICNANGCDTGILSIFVICDSLTATRPPVAVFDVATTPKNTPIRITILANDTLNGTLDSIKIIRSPLLGIASLDSNNILIYTPDSCGFTDSLIYRICNGNGCDTAIIFIKVTCDVVITDPLRPVAVFDTTGTGKNQPITIQVTLNDTLRGADTFRITRNPIHGLALFDALRQIAYKPDSLYCGNDTLIYEICNQRGCDTALVTIQIRCDVVPTLRPVAVDDVVKTTVNRQVDFVILGNDTLRGARSAEMVSPPSHGTILIMPDSMAMYKPDKEFCGRDSFMYRICNVVGCDTAWVKIEVICGDTLEVFRGFSPNGDNKNDLFVIRGIENFPDNEVLVFNRWGNQVFSRKGYRNEDGWNGTWSEKYVPDGTYFYFIRLNDVKNQQFTGYIQLRR